MEVNIVHSIFMVHKEIGDGTMNFINPIFMAIKMKITSFSWIFNESWFHSDIASNFRKYDL